MTRPDYPETRIEDASDVFWGVTVPDPYRWLESAATSETQAWMDAQDRLAQQVLGQSQARAALQERLAELMYVDTVGTPERKGDSLFYWRRRAHQEKAVFYVRSDDQDVALIDPNQMSEDGSTSVSTVVPSPDGRLVAWAKRENNADEASIYVRDVQTGLDLGDVLEGTKYAMPSWLPDSSGFFYTFLPQDGDVPVSERPGTADIRFHRLGTPQTDDPEIHPCTGDARTFIGADVSRDGRWLLVTVFHGWHKSDIYVMDRSAASPRFEPLSIGADGLSIPEVHDGVVYLHTNVDAPNWRIAAIAPDADPGSVWRDVIPNRPDIVVEGFQFCGGHLVVRTQKNAYSGIEIWTIDGTHQRDVRLPTMGAVNTVSGHPEHDTFWYRFESLTRPPTILEASVTSEDTMVWAEVELPIELDAFEAEQVWYPSADGTQVSMFVVTPRGAPRDKSMPFILYGYGGFMRSMLPEFRSSIFPWLESGGGYAIANLRGGGEYGEAWHRAGMRENKQNVFDDFIAAAEYLCAEGYTAPERLGIYGGSNGGLLVGAAVTQRPSLFSAVVCAVPLLDMVRYDGFGSGKTWTGEYGSVSDSRALFEAIHAYSPYHRVVDGEHYPAVLFQSADSDDRVDPMHARKMAARLQAANASDNPILLRIERNAGHGGADLVASTIDRLTDMYAFFIEQGADG